MMDVLQGGGEGGREGGILQPQGRVSKGLHLKRTQWCSGTSASPIGQLPSCSCGAGADAHCQELCQRWLQQG
jgi:hypothetical protein